MRDLLGGKGANLAEMTSLGLPVPEGLHHHHRGVHRLHGRRQRVPGRPRGRGSAHLAALEAARGQAARRRRRTRCWSRCAVGRQVLDAGDDGHRPEPRAQRRVGARASRSRPATSASPTTRTAASCRCSARSCSTSRSTSSRTRSRPVEAKRGRRRRRRPDRRGPRGAGRDVQGRSYRERSGEDFPQDPRDQLDAAIEAVFKSWNGKRAHDYRRLEPHPRRSRAPRSTSRRWCSATRATTPAPASRSPATRRPVRRRARTATSSSTRRAKTWSPASAPPRRSELMATSSPRRTRSSSRSMDLLEKPLPRHVRHRVHHRAGAPLHAADARRQAHARRRCAWRSRWSDEGLDRPRSEARAARRRPPRSTSCCTRSSTRRPRRAARARA